MFLSVELYRNSGMIARKKPKHWPKDAIHLYIWDLLPKQYNIHICKIKTETIFSQTTTKDTITLMLLLSRWSA